MTSVHSCSRPGHHHPHNFLLLHLSLLHWIVGLTFLWIITSLQTSSADIIPDHFLNIAMNFSVPINDDCQMTDEWSKTFNLHSQDLYMRKNRVDPFEVCFHVNNGHIHICEEAAKPSIGIVMTLLYAEVQHGILGHYIELTEDNINDDEWCIRVTPCDIFEGCSSCDVSNMHIQIELSLMGIRAEKDSSVPCVSKTSLHLRDTDNMESSITSPSSQSDLEPHIDMGGGGKEHNEDDDEEDADENSVVGDLLIRGVGVSMNGILPQSELTPVIPYNGPIGVSIDPELDCGDSNINCLIESSNNALFGYTWGSLYMGNGDLSAQCRTSSNKQRSHFITFTPALSCRPDSPRCETQLNLTAFGYRSTQDSLASLPIPPTSSSIVILITTFLFLLI